MGVCLIRHSSTLYNERGLSQGSRIDLPLSPQGIAETEELRGKIEALTPRAVYSSPLRRAVQTAAILAEPFGEEPQILPAFTELDMGVIAGRHFFEFPAELERFKRDFLNFCPPQGESVQHMLGRVWPALLELLEAHQDGNCLLVTHFCVIRAIFLKCGGSSDRTSFPNGSLFYAELRDGVPILTVMQL